MEIKSNSLYDFAMSLQEGVINGYRVSDKTPNFPMEIGGTFLATLVKDVSDSVIEDIPLQEEVLPSKQKKAK